MLKKEIALSLALMSKKIRPEQVSAFTMSAFIMIGQISSPTRQAWLNPPTRRCSMPVVIPMPTTRIKKCTSSQLLNLRKRRRSDLWHKRA